MMELSLGAGGNDGLCIEILKRLRIVTLLFYVLGRSRPAPIQSQNHSSIFVCSFVHSFGC